MKKIILLAAAVAALPLAACKPHNETVNGTTTDLALNSSDLSTDGSFTNSYGDTSLGGNSALDTGGYGSNSATSANSLAPALNSSSTTGGNIH